MPERPNHVVFGALGRRIVNLAASPNGRFLALQHVPLNYDSADYHWLYFRAEEDTFVEMGALPGYFRRRAEQFFCGGGGSGKVRAVRRVSP